MLDPLDARRDPLSRFRCTRLWLREARGGTSPRAPATIVTVAQSLQKTVPVEVTAVGNVEAISTISIRAQVAGEVRNIHFKEGDLVKKGQVLLTIDPRPYRAALAQAKAALARDKATGTYESRAGAALRNAFRPGRSAAAGQVDSFTSAADASDATVNADGVTVKTAELIWNTAQSSRRLMGGRAPSW